VVVYRHANWQGRGRNEKPYFKKIIPMLGWYKLTFYNSKAEIILWPRWAKKIICSGTVNLGN
jgi:hypothetical protein